MKTEKLLLRSLFIIGCAGTIFTTMHLSHRDSPNHKMPRVIESRIVSDLSYLSYHQDRKDSISMKVITASDKFTH